MGNGSRGTATICSTGEQSAIEPAVIIALLLQNSGRDGNYLRSEAELDLDAAFSLANSNNLTGSNRLATTADSFSCSHGMRLL